MIWIILFALGATIVIGLDGGFGEGILAGVLAGVLGFIVAVLIGTAIQPTSHHRVRYSLDNIQDNSVTHGSFFLGSGTVGGTPTFSFYVQENENSYVRQDADASISTVHYTNGRPYVVHRWTSYVSKVRPLYIAIGESDPASESYDFYVPKGSIIQEYRLDAK